MCIRDSNLVLGEEPAAEENSRDSFIRDNGDQFFEGPVLLVEDNALNMEIAQEFIGLCGGTTECAWNGEEAVRMFKDASAGYYKLIFMDVQMPQMDGYDATRQIRLVEEASGRMHTPIVAMSANAFVEDIDKAYAAGMDSYVTKPIGIEEVRRTLYEYAHKRPLNHIKGSLKS